MKLGILTVNRNNLQLTQDLFEDLTNQTSPFELTVVDNASSEPGTKKWLATIRDHPIVKMVRENDSNVPLNHLWNWFHASTTYPYLCFLNNDIRLPSNFVSDTIQVLDQNAEVGCAVHSTNHPKYSSPSPTLQFETTTGEYRQGWDFTLRREVYTPIPPELEWFCGDGWLFTFLRNDGWKIAYIYSSPIIHFQGQTDRVANQDALKFSKMKEEAGWPRLRNYGRYTRIKPPRK